MKTGKGKKIHEKIMRINFAKRLKQVFIAGICIAILGGGLSAVMLRTQISEVVAAARTWEQQDHSQDNSVRQTSEHPYWEHGNEDIRMQWWEEHHDDEADFLEQIEISEPSAAAMITAAGASLLFGLAVIVFCLLIAAWLYKAAALAAMRRCKCPVCGKWHRTLKAQYCTACGSAMSKTCPACGKTCKSEDVFCGHCGKPL